LKRLSPIKPYLLSLLGFLIKYLILKVVRYSTFELINVSLYYYYRTHTHREISVHPCMLNLLAQQKQQNKQCYNDVQIYKMTYHSPYSEKDKAQYYICIHFSIHI